MGSRAYIESLRAVIKNIVNSEIDDIRITLPGKIEKYDNTTNFASIKLLVGKKMVGGQRVDLPIIENVLILFLGNSNVNISFKPEVGDNVLVMFSDIDISSWTHRQIEGFPESIRRFNINDCYAIIADTRKGASPLANDEALKITAGNSEIVSKSDGTVLINNHLEVTL